MYTREIWFCIFAANAFEPNDVSVEGIVSVPPIAQFWNAPIPKVVSPSLSVTDVRLSQL